MPAAVSMDGDGFYRVDYSMLGYDAGRVAREQPRASLSGIPSSTQPRPHRRGFSLAGGAQKAQESASSN
jgi:hypothetical protein